MLPPKPTEAAAPKATKAATAAPGRIAPTPTHGYEERRGQAAGGSIQNDSVLAQGPAGASGAS
jgi:hypothetical protein